MTASIQGFREWLASDPPLIAPEDRVAVRRALEAVNFDAIVAQFIAEAQAIPTSSAYKRKTAGVVIVRQGETEDSDGEILLVHEAGSASWRTDYSIPKGGIDDGEDAWSAAMRELREEVGLDLTDMHLRGPYRIVTDSADLTYWVGDVTGRPLPSEWEEDDLPSPSEVDWAGFVPSTDAVMQIAAYQREVLKNIPGEDSGGDVPSMIYVSPVAAKLRHVDLARAPKWAAQVVVHLERQAAEWTRYFAEHGWSGLQLVEIGWDRARAKIEAVWERPDTADVQLTLGLFGHGGVVTIRPSMRIGGVLSSPRKVRKLHLGRDTNLTTSLKPEMLVHAAWLDALADEHRTVSSLGDGTHMITLPTLTYVGIEALSPHQRELAYEVLGHIRRHGYTVVHLRLEPNGRAILAFVDEKTREHGAFILGLHGAPQPWPGKFPKIIPDATDRLVMLPPPPGGESIEMLKTRRVRSPRPGDAPSSRIVTRQSNKAEWSKRADKAYRAIRDLGFEVDKALGCGSFGCAFAGTPYVLKLTSDPNEVANVKTIIENNGCKGVAAPRSAFGFKGIPGMYAIIMEQVQPATRSEQAWTDQWRIDYERYLLHMGEITSKEYKAAVKIARDDGAARIPKTNVSDLLEGIDCLYDLGVLYEDGHGGNIGVRVEGTKRTLVYLDLGFSGGPTQSIPIIEP